VSSIQAIIVAGGRGTRSLNPQIPKILQELTPGTTLLDQHMKNLSSLGIVKVTFLLGFGSAQIIDVLETKHLGFHPFEISWVVEKVLNGTGPALDAFKSSVTEEDLLIILGDTAICADYALHYKNWRSSQALIGFFCHPNLHPEDSDVLEVSNDGAAMNFWEKKIKRKVSSPVRALTGSYFVKSSVLRTNRPTNRNKDLVKYLISKVESLEQILPIQTRFYFADTGTADRLEKVQKDFKSGVFSRRGRIDAGAIFIDRDGCLIPDIENGREFVQESDFERDAIEGIRMANLKGIPIFLVTNQPAIAKGRLTGESVERVQLQIEEILANRGAILDGYKFCPHHPEKGFPGEKLELKISCKCRKPNPGMAADLSILYGISLSKSIVIGDTSRDEGLADSIGAKFILGRHSHNEVGEALHKSIQFISDNF
jgi:mannose-1-phosphate guanylyltransferase/phosphomannomutase